MACKDCIHFEMCNRTEMKDCPHFKDRSQFVKVVHGRWEWIEDNSNECSVCRHTAFFYPLLETVPNYCPNCGAKMDGGDTP